MVIKLIASAEHVSGGLWFVFPSDLQPYVIPWLRTLIKEAKFDKETNQYYRANFTKTAAREKYSSSILATRSLSPGHVAFYMLYGEWRVGERGCLTTDQVKDDILNSLENFFQQSR